jgi:Flp pilus assembly protein TadG
MSLFSRFRANNKGNTSILFAATILPMLICAGAAVDFVETNRTLSVLQTATDAAVVAGGSSGKTDQAELQAVVENYLTANNTKQVLDQIDSIETVFDDTTRTFSVRVKGKRNTSLMHLAGITTMDLGAYSEVKLGNDGLEVALVLDNTGSMNASGRMEALKNSAGGLVDKLLAAEASGAYVRVGIVPFAEYVNVGMGVRNKPWMNVPDDSSKTVEQCTNTYPDATSSNCRQETYSGVSDGVPYSGTHTVCDWDYGAPKSVCTDVEETKKWYGCVGSRNNPLDENIGTSSSPYPGLQNAWCGAEIVTLTDDKAKLKSTISAMTANGNTYVPAGLLWGWNMLSSDEPLDQAKTASAINAMGGKKAIVLMTDGDNTLSADYPWHWGTDGDKADKKVKDLCKNIKDDEIVVYTVSFMVTDAPTIDMLEKCASDSSKAFTADNAAQLAQAFNEIGASMLSVRLSK